MITKIKNSINKQQIGLTADQTQQKRGLVNWKIGQQKNNQIETKEKRLNTSTDIYTKRETEKEKETGKRA